MAVSHTIKTVAIRLNLRLGTQSPTRATRTQYTRQAETVKEGNEGQDEEIQTRIRQETTYRPTTYKSLVPTTVSRKVSRAISDHRNSLRGATS